jgi:hypothetical protein
MTFSTTLAKRLSLLALPLIVAALAAGCGSKAIQDPAATAQNQEREKLLAENQDFTQVATENQEAKRLKLENQELPRLRNQYQEAIRLRKDNEQLRQQITKISPAAATNQVAAGEAGQGAPGAPGAPVGDQPDKENPKEVAQDENALNEGDEVVIDPKQLKQLLPDFDWEKLGRKEPLGVRSLLEKDGVQITNTQQLREYGLTNYIIRRAQPAPQPAPQPTAPETR